MIDLTKKKPCIFCNKNTGNALVFEGKLVCCECAEAIDKQLYWEQV